MPAMTINYRDPINYYDYLKSPEWQRRAFEAKRRARFRCQVCNAPGNVRRLHTHHRTYARLGHEDPEDLLVACEDCHQIISENVELYGDGIRE
ncbi:MAG: HNH endonuclease [Anaerolineae bacterium]|nr:HNH endonuclease [Anaerolineae bacterium]